MKRQPRYGDRVLGLPDRRDSVRFPLRLTIKYRLLGSSKMSDWMVTQTVNVSSGGVFFVTAEAVLPGQSLEAYLAWPALLDKHIPLRLATKGAVVRNDGLGIAMRFETYEFRTGQIHPEAHHITSLRPEVNGQSGLKIAG